MPAYHTLKQHLVRDRGCTAAAMLTIGRHTEVDLVRARRLPERVAANEKIILLPWSTPNIRMSSAAYYFALSIEQVFGLLY